MINKLRVNPVTIGKATLYNCDCMELLKNTPDKFYDLALTDPPYNVGRKYNSHNDEMEDYEDWCDCWFSELLRVSRTVVLTVGYKNMKYWINKNPKHILIWHKPNQNSPSPLGGFNAYEPVFYFGELQKRLGHDIFSTNIAMQPDASFHNCPKHLNSWTYILSLIAKQDCKVLDIFLGSGTTAISCNNLGFELTACELDKDYFEAACKRIEQASKQTSLFEPQQPIKPAQEALL